MAEFDQGSSQNQGSWADSHSQSVNQGLRTYMLRVYNLMALGVAFTALVVLVMMNNPGLMQTIAMGPMKWVLFIAVLALGWFSPKLIFSGSMSEVCAVLWAFARSSGQSEATAAGKGQSKLTANNTQAEQSSLGF